MPQQDPPLPDSDSTDSHCSDSSICHAPPSNESTDLDTTRAAELLSHLMSPACTSNEEEKDANDVELEVLYKDVEAMQHHRWYEKLRRHTIKSEVLNTLCVDASLPSFSQLSFPHSLRHVTLVCDR